MQPCLIGSQNDSIVSGEDRLGFKFGRAINDDNMRQHRGISVVLQVPRDNTNPTTQWIKDLDRPYGVHYDMFP
jgi:hypothetical protein